jgi:hypothetical protein
MAVVDPALTLHGGRGVNTSMHSSPPHPSSAPGVCRPGTGSRCRQGGGSGAQRGEPAALV